MSNSGNSIKQTLSTNSNLDILVSKWKQKDVEKELHISCDGPALPSFILQRLNTTEQSNTQEEYIRKLKTYLQLIDVHILDFLTTEIITRDLDGTTLPLKDALKEIMKNVKAKEGTESNITYKIKDFLKAVKHVMKQFEEYRLKARRTVYETTFTRFVSSLARLCYLDPQCSLANDKDSQSIWDNFRGQECFSEPDIRIRKSGIIDANNVVAAADDESAWVVVSVVKVKLKDGDDTCRRKTMTRMKPSGSSSSSSSSTESSSANDDKVFLHYPHRYRRKKVKSNDDLPVIPMLNIQRVLGQHAGELLFDLHRYLKDTTDVKVVRMPGMIVDGVKVIFTLLEMQYEHLKKLRENEELDHEDKAVLYYTRPFDILSRRDRDTVLEYFVKLNNMNL